MKKELVDDVLNGVLSGLIVIDNSVGELYEADRG